MYIDPINQSPTEVFADPCSIDTKNSSLVFHTYETDGKKTRTSSLHLKNGLSTVAPWPSKNTLLFYPTAPCWETGKTIICTERQTKTTTPASYCIPSSNLEEDCLAGPLTAQSASSPRLRARGEEWSRPSQDSRKVCRQGSADSLQSRTILQGLCCWHNKHTALLCLESPLRSTTQHKGPSKYTATWAKQINSAYSVWRGSRMSAFLWTPAEFLYIVFTFQREFALPAWQDDLTNQFSTEQSKEHGMRCTAEYRPVSIIHTASAHIHTSHRTPAQSAWWFTDNCQPGAGYLCEKMLTKGREELKTKTLQNTETNALRAVCDAGLRERKQHWVCSLVPNHTVSGCEQHTATPAASWVPLLGLVVSETGKST